MGNCKIDVLIIFYVKVIMDISHKAVGKIGWRSENGMFKILK